MKVVTSVLRTLFVAVLLVVAGGAAVAWHEGYSLYAVRSGSMAPTYPTGTLIIDAPAGRQLPSVGNVITFRTSGGLVTHRVHSHTADGVTTKGDANRTPDVGVVHARHVVGVVTWAVAGGGYVLVFLQQPTGIASLVLLAVAVMLAWSIFFPASKPQQSPGRARAA